MIALQDLFQEIKLIKYDQELTSRLAPKIGEYFSATRSQIFLVDQLITNKKLKKALEIATSVEINPIARYLTERHTPVHESQVTTPKAWSIICPRPDHWHVMAGPIIHRGTLIGIVGCTREKAMSAFEADNLADMSAICLHLSDWVSTTRIAMQPNKATLLTSRQLQITELVALGRTNAEIGNELWITENSVKQALKRIFRKLEVSSRAELVAQLYRPESLSPSSDESEPSRLRA